MHPDRVKEIAEKHLEDNTLCEHPEPASYIRDKACGEGDWRWQTLWIKHCLSPRTNLLFADMEHFKGQQEKQQGEQPDEINREEDVNFILRQRKFLGRIEAKEAANYYKQVIADWFLRRYNWTDGLSAYYPLLGDRATKIYRRIVASIVILLTVITFALVCVYLFPIPHSVYWAEIVFLVLAIGIFAIIIRWHRFAFMRLIVTIMVGFVPLAGNRLLWEVAVIMNWWMLAIVSFLAFSAGLAYCFAECVRITSLTRWQALKRALPVTLWGILFAIVIAIVISYVVGATVVGGIQMEDISFYQGRYGTVYPAAVFLFAPGSLLIGLFINSFWQERTISEPF
jgi:hypothetical protein